MWTKDFKSIQPVEMSIHSWLNLLKKHRGIAVICAREIELARKMAKATASGGVKLIKVSWNNSGSKELISQLRIELPNCTIGAGTHTVLKQSQVKEMITAGCQFIFTSYVNPLIINTGIESNLPIIPSALTPTEIVNAWQSGAVCVKVFPIESFGGKSYIKSLQGPLGHIPLIAAGGITLENAEEFLTAGALAIELNRQLFPKELVTNGNWKEISQKAAQLTKKIL